MTSYRSPLILFRFSSLEAGTSFSLLRSLGGDAFSGLGAPVILLMFASLCSFRACVLVWSAVCGCAIAHVQLQAAAISSVFIVLRSSFWGILPVTVFCIAQRAGLCRALSLAPAPCAVNH